MKEGRGGRQLSLLPSSKLLVSDSLQGSSSHISEAKNAESGSSGYYLSLGVSLREDATDTRADDWLLSRCASLSNLRYSSPEEKGRGVTLSGVWLLVACALSSTHDSANKELASCISGLQTPARMERCVCTSDVRWKIFHRKYSRTENFPEIFRNIFPENFPFLKIIT
jgi:hypothetical protein